MDRDFRQTLHKETHLNTVSGASQLEATEFARVTVQTAKPEDVILFWYEFILKRS